MQKILLFFLSSFARLILSIHRPKIIAITGTVGKTTITANIGTLLRLYFPEKDISLSPYHYNGEYGVPLSIIGAKTGRKNPFLWIQVFLIALVRCIQKYPKYLILEYGIDHVGEMDFLLSIAHPDIVIISPIAPNHLEQFGTIENYRKEKLKIMQFIQDSGNILAHESLKPYIERDVIHYGIGGMSHIDASHFTFSLKSVGADVHVGKKNFHLELPSFGAYQIENLLPCYGICEILGLDPVKIEENGSLFTPESGRSSIISGQNESTIIDGSYNGGYESITKGIESTLPFLPSHRIIYFLGDMRELGDASAELHENLASFIREHIGKEREVHFVLVGPLMRKYVLPQLKQIYAVETFLSSKNAGEYIKNLLETGEQKQSLIYVKGSQNTIFLEEGIKHFLKNKKDHSKLCRQGKEWIKKKEEFFSSLQEK